MNLTIKDVLSHPPIKRVVFTKTKIEIERMSDILQVLQLYDKLQSTYRSHKLTELTMKNGQEDNFMHFKECPWSSGDEGPGTFICCYVITDCAKIIDILDKLNLDGESERLKTIQIKNWTLSSPTPKDLAAAGFYYLADKDRVRCHFCGAERGEWEKEDNPLILHKNGHLHVHI